MKTGEELHEGTPASNEIPVGESTQVITPRSEGSSATTSANDRTSATAPVIEDPPSTTSAIESTPAMPEYEGNSSSNTSSNISSRSSTENLLHSIRPLQPAFSSTKTARMGKSVNLTYSPEFYELQKKMLNKKELQAQKYRRENKKVLVQKKCSNLKKVI